MAQKIQLVALVPLKHNDQRFEKGATFSAPEARAEQLIKDGAAELKNKPAPKAEPAPAAAPSVPALKS